MQGKRWFELAKVVARTDYANRSPLAPLGKNQEFETNAPPGHGSTTALDF